MVFSNIKKRRSPGRLLAGSVSLLMALTFTATPFYISPAAASDGGATVPEYKADSIIVKFKPGVSTAEADTTVKSHGDKVEESVDKVKIKEVKVGEGQVLPEIAAYSQDSRVEYAEPNYKRTALIYPNDPSWGAQWNMTKISMPQAWLNEKGNPAVYIAVIDTGVSTTHPDLTAKLVQGIDLVGEYPSYTPDNDPHDENGHGTHVAGIAAASTNNGIGVAGVAWNPKIMPVRVLDESGSGYDSTIAEAIVWAADAGAKVINMSLGGSGYSQSMADAVNYAYGRGVVVVAAAGNSNSNQPFYPASLPHVISVASTNSSDSRSSFSNYGPTIDVAAPGESIYSTTISNFSSGYGLWPDSWTNTYATFSGTSMASPHVAGQAALLVSQNPGYNPDQIEQQIKSTADDKGAPGRDDLYGSGRINVYRSLVPYASAWFGNYSAGGGFGTGTSTSASWGNATGDDPLTGDMNGDGYADLLLHRANAYPNWFVKLSGAGGFGSTTDWSLAWGNTSGDTPLVGDFNGDGLKDIAMYRWGAYPNWYFKLSTPSGFAAETTPLTWGNAFGDKPIVGDFNGDGKDDVGLYRTGSYPNWFVRVINGATAGIIQFGGTWATSWGNAGGDNPLVGDFNGDSRDDIGINRLAGYPNWFANYSNGTGIDSVTDTYTSWGNPYTDTPLIGDVNADGKADLVIVRKSGYPNWFLKLSGTGGFGIATDSSLSWGSITNETPLLGDFNNDSRADTCIFRRP